MFAISPITVDLKRFFQIFDFDSATLTALESLLIRGYDVSGVILLETGYENQHALQEYASR